MEDVTEDTKPVRGLPSQEQRKPMLKDLNNFLMCRLCGGYLVEATSIVECLHTYCRSCIVQFLQNSKCCPICETSVTNKLNPCLSLRPDKIIQRLVYKTVPGLYKNELERRKKYSTSSEDAEGKKTITESGDLPTEEYYFAPEELISISLEYVEEKNLESKTPSSKADSTDMVESSEVNSTTAPEIIELVTHKRYLQCPAAVKIEHIYKFIKLKYNLQSNHEVEISYENVRLPNYFSLMDTAYMFSWKREKPMRLCYQIFERTFIQVPVVVPNKILDDYVPPVKNSSYQKQSLSSDVNSTADSRTQNDSKQNSYGLDGNASKLNFKRKSDLVSKVATESENSNDTFEFLEPSVKIPRIESNGRPSTEVEGKEERTETQPAPAPEPPSSTKMDVDVGTLSGIDSGCDTSSPRASSLNFKDYEQDIEEVDEVEDEVNDDETRPTPLPELVIDTTDNYEDKKSKYKRKSKKSKHHHHRKHRHHERKKSSKQATILSPDADTGIMKLKLKISNTPTESRHHKQSKRKHKKNSETYFSYSSSSSVTLSSPELNVTSKIDEDSSHSQISECSAESIAENNLSRSEAPKIESCRSSSDISATKVETVSKDEKEITPDKQKCLPTVNTKDESPIVRDSQNKDKIVCSSPTPVRASTPASFNIMKMRSPSNKDRIAQMRKFRPKSIAIVRPEEHIDEKAEAMRTKNDDNNNDKPAPILSAVEPEKPEVGSLNDIRRTAASALTVSKITAAEMKKEQKKLQLFTSNKEEPPALEITVVPASKGLAAVPSPTLNDSTALTIRPSKPSQKPIKPIPAAIPLSQYQRMKSSEQFTSSNSLPKLTEHNLPKSLTITPHTQRTPKLNGDVLSKKMVSDMKDTMKQSVTISLSENDSVLDLSGAPKPQVLYSQNKKVLGNGLQNIGLRMNGISSHFSPSLGNKMANENVVRPMQKIPEMHIVHKSSASPYPVVSLPLTSSLSSTPKNVKLTTSFTPTILRSQMPIRMSSIKINNKVHTLPQLNEIKTGPPSKPGPNQSVRSIPTVNTILQRQQQQLMSTFRPTPTEVAMMQQVMSSSCSFSNLKKPDKCPPAMPIHKAYIDRSNLMVTK